MTDTDQRNTSNQSSVEKAAERLARASGDMGNQIRDVSLSPGAAGIGGGHGGAAAGMAVPAAMAAAKIVPPPRKADSDRTSKQVEIDTDRLREMGMVTPDGDRSLIAEEFRIVKRPLLLKAFDSGPEGLKNGNLIMVASCAPGEGKTFTAISLAMSIASERDLTVMLVDADVAKRDIPRSLGIEVDRGLVDLVADDSLDLSDVLLRTQLENLTVLPAGRHHTHSTELLASERMGRIMREIAQRYTDRIVIFDSPPVLMNSVASVLALHVGQILFVVEADKTTEAGLDNALSLVSSCKNISLLLNKGRAVGDADRFGYYSYYD